MGRPQQHDMEPQTPLGDEGAIVVPSDNINPGETIASENEETNMTDGPEYFAPPAHLAARFWNKSAARRKSSATSSRRNSLSSVNSHGSSLSQRRASSIGCQSNYIAQHLRRASIIESRKARLADRAAHAEQVRLRAALVKAAPRGSISNSEERALAAQLAKEKYLAKVAAACAEEVARAKRIAEEVKERKLAEEARVRLEMEERQVEAEKRRAEYQRNLQARRARRADSSEKKLSTLEEIVDMDEEAVVDDTTDETATEVPELKLTPDRAARRLQRTFRLHLRHKIVQAYTSIDLHGRSTRDSFEDMTALVAETHTIETTTALLTQLGLQDKNDENASLNTRTFLSAFMLTGHPITVLNNKNGAQEQDLLAKSTELINQFASTIARLAGWNNFSPNATQLETLSQAYSAYTSAFAAWRLQDSSVIIEGMVASFVELDAIWQTVKDDTRGEVASDYREGIRDNQVMLLSRIRKLAGPDRADTLIKKAIRESRKKRPKKRPTAEVRPRGVESAQTETPAARSSFESTVESPVDAVELPNLALNPPSGVVQIKDLDVLMPSNRVLTHELAINKDFKLEDTKAEKRGEVYGAICEHMKQAFEAGTGGVWTVSAAENVREKLLRMLKPGNSMHTLISNTLDLDSINRQCQQGVFSYDGFFEFMAQILPKLCAPFRDAEIKALTEELQTSNADVNAMIDKLLKLLRAVDLLSLDYTNFMIMNAAPTLLREAPGYEHRMFAKDLESGTISLDKTKTWWRSSYATLSAEADRRDPEAVRNPADRPASHKVYAHALLGLAAEQGELQEASIPETLMLDVGRLQRIRSEVIRLSIVGAVLLTAKNLLRRDSRSQWKNEASRLWQLLSAERYDGRTDNLTTSQKAFGILENAHNMPPATKQHLSGTIARFFAQAAAISAPSHSTSVRLTDPVLKVLFQRLRTHIGSRLSASTSSERVRAASSASEALASFGMPEFTAQVGTIVETLEKVREVDWKAHAVWHESVFRELLQAESAGGGG